MRQEIEIEYKNMLTKNEFQKLMQVFSITKQQFVIQENFYFDTPDFALKEKGAALRIRYKKGKYILTLKQPAKEGLLETHQDLTTISAESMLNGGSIVDGAVSDIIKNMNINPLTITYFGSLITNRAEMPYKNGILVLDNSSYLSIDDYELEYEVTDAAEGQAAFLELLKTNKIPVRKTENKIRRFYNEKLRQNTNGDNS